MDMLIDFRRNQPGSPLPTYIKGISITVLIFGDCDRQ